MRTVEKLFLGFSLVILTYIEVLDCADRECAALPMAGKSVVCVCNATYCDTITREPPPCGGYVAYTSSEAGLRFSKTYGKIEPYEIPPSCVTTLELNPKVLFQQLSGFGGAATDSSAINLMSLKHPGARKHLIDSYFSRNGIEYSMIRVPIGGTDFSTHKYAYSEHPAEDDPLENFALTSEDYELKIPFIRAAMRVAPEQIRVVASLWSPPPYMKDVNSYTSGYLKTEYYQTLADYICKFLEQYQDSKIPIWGLTTTNEPSNGIMVKGELNRMQWKVFELGQWIQNNLGPTIRNSAFKNIKIIVGDDQRNMIPYWFNTLVEQSPGALRYIDGVGVHFYLDQLTPADQLTKPLEDYPEIFLLYTEACEGNLASEIKRVDLGSWTRAESYAGNIIEDLNHKVIGWIDWNMCLDESGGPAWTEGFVDSPIIVSSRRQEFYKQPMFYALGHFSKFLPRGSRRMLVEQSTCNTLLPNVAFLTPQKTIAMVVMNKGRKPRKLLIKLDEDSTLIYLEAKSFTTIEFPYQSDTATC